VKWLAALSAVFLAAGAWSNSDEVSYQDDVLPILVNECSYCHVRDDRYAFLALDGETAYPSLVGVPSYELPSMMRVAPGDLSGSYLWLKLTGQHIEAGGSGWLMPYFPLEPPMLETIRRWIEQGAPDN
jgi:hypothetical protein